MTNLHALSQSAMLGTGNGITMPAFDPLKIPVSDPETTLLASAAGIGIAEIGGRKPVHLDGSVPVCPEETDRQLPERAGELLKRMLAGEFEPVLPELLELIAWRKLLAPPETLPSLLGLDKKELRPLIIQAAGNRGRWLAEQNPAWSFALGREPLDAWEHGTREERVMALEQMRTSDPKKAREWVHSTWEQDSSEDRAAFLAAFAVGLSMDDEPLLEACLDDKRKEVRETARDLLVRLEESRLVQRMWSRAKPLIRLKSKFLSGDKLEVTLPEDLDAKAKRDGIGAWKLRKNMGEKARLLAQMLALVPPVFWSREFGRTPEKLVAAALTSEWKEPVLVGWQLAAQAAGDVEWAEAIAPLWVRAPVEASYLDTASRKEIILLMRPEKVEELVEAHIRPRIKGLEFNNLLVSFLIEYTRPWTEKLARTVVGNAQRQPGEVLYYLSQQLPGFARWIPPELAEEFSRGWTADPASAWSRNIDTFLMTLRFRNEIRRSLMD